MLCPSLVARKGLNARTTALPLSRQPDIAMGFASLSRFSGFRGRRPRRNLAGEEGRTMGEAHISGVSMAAMAWVVAIALAVGLAGAGAALVSYRRWRRTLSRLRSLEEAVAEFRAALQARLAVERARRIRSE